MNTKQMEYILELAKTGNFNRAAENLYISQPTMTYQIRAVEQEIGFPIFSRSGKGASLTPAGMQFVTTLRSVVNELKTAVEQGQNFAAEYKENIRIVVPIRSAVYFLPQAIIRLHETEPSVSVTPSFDWYHGMDSFLRGEQDILFAIRDEVRHIPDIDIHPLFESRIYLVTETSDPLAQKESVCAEDLKGRTLMVGGPSPAPLRAVQHRVITETGCDYFNSESHDMSLTYVASHQGIVLSPGFLNDHTGAFAWIPFRCPEVIPCVLCTHRNDRRPFIQSFIELMQSFYEDPDFAC